MNMVWLETLFELAPGALDRRSRVHGAPRFGACSAGLSKRWSMSAGLRASQMSHRGRKWRSDGSASHRGAGQTRPNPIVDWYRADPASRQCGDLSLTGHGTADLWRDLIVLKSPSGDEKGVILLKYARTFSAVVALFDLKRLMNRYQFVLEPCWAGYCDPALLMFVAAGEPVIVQCFTDADHDFVSRIGYPLLPVRLGPAVGRRVGLRGSAGRKEYDLVMVANSTKPSNT